MYTAFTSSRVEVCPYILMESYHKEISINDEASGVRYDMGEVTLEVHGEGVPWGNIPIPKVSIPIDAF